MATQPNTPKTAAQYIAEAGKHINGLGSTAPLKMGKLPSVNVGGTGAAQSTSQTPLGWLTDILSRPLYGMTDMITGGVKEGIADAQGKWGEGLQDASQHNFFTGMFSTAANNKHTTSDLIENTTDELGALDPKYKNVQNNVNPILKGIAGFAGDILLDPTTYIPGAQLAKGAKLGLDGVKALMGGIDLAKGAKAAKTAEEAAKALPEITANGVAGAKTARADTDVADATASAEAASPTPVVDAPVAAKDTVAQLVAATQDKIKTAVSDPKHADLKNALAAIVPSKLQKLTTAVVDTKHAVPLDFDKWLAGATAKVKSTFEKLPNEKIAPTLAKMPKVSIGGKDIPIAAALQRAAKGDQVALEDLRHYHAGIYTTVFNKAAANGKLLDPLYEEIKPASAAVVNSSAVDDLAEKASDDASDVQDFQYAIDHPDEPTAHDPSITNAQYVQNEVAAANESDSVTNHDPYSVLGWMQGEAEKSAQAVEAARSGATPGAETVLNSLQSFKQQLAVNEEAVRGALGNGLVNNLKTFTNPISFDKAIATLKGIMDQSIDVTAMNRIPPSAARLLERLGLDPATIPTGVKQIQKTAGIPGAGKIDPEMLARMGAEDNQHVIDLAAGPEGRDLGNFVKKDIGEPQDPTKMPFTTTMEKAKRTHQDIGQGTGRILREVNTYSQGNLAMDLFEKSGKLAQKLTPNIAGAAMASAKSTFFRQALRLRERVLDQMGVPMTLGVGYGNGQDRILLSGSQLLDTMHDANARVLDTTVFNHATAVPYTNLLDAGFVAAKGGSREDIISELSKTMNTYRTKSFDNNLIAPATHIGKNGLKYMLGTKLFTGEQLTNDLADLIQKVTPQLQKQVELNTAAHVARGLDETKRLTNDQLEKLEQIYATKNGFGSILQAINDVTPRLMDESKSIGAMDESLNKASAIIEASVPELDKSNAKAAVATQKIADKVSKDLLNSKMTHLEMMKQVQKATVATAQHKYENAVALAAKFDPNGATLDMGSNTSQAIGQGIVSKVAPVFSRSFGNEDLHDALVVSENRFRDTLSPIAATLSQISSKYDKETLTEAFRNLQKGLVSGNEATAQAASELEPLVQQMFGGAVDAEGKAQPYLANNAFFRENNAIDHINASFEAKGLGDFVFSADDAGLAARKSGRSIMQEAADQWKGWKVDDPAATINQLYTSLLQVNTHQSAAQDFVLKAKQLGLTSATAKPGYVRLTNDGGKSIFYHYVPKDTYFEQGIARQFAVVDSLTRDTLQIGGPIGSFVNNIYRPALDIFKWGMTLINPSHHIRNALSDMDLTRDAEGITTRPIYKHAMEAVASHNSYDQFDAIAALQGAKITPKPGRIIISGKLGKLSPGTLYAEMASRGNLPQFRRLENLDEATEAGRGALSHLWEKITESKVAQKIGGISEARDHWTRLAHADQFIAKHINDTSTYKTLDDLLDAASHQVRKWHPDGSDLTHSEQVFRLIIPFYSWQRKSIPLILEAYLTHPARVQAIPKASYNLAVAMGVNPDSLSDPFPQDQMFPSYMTSQVLGPQFNIGGKYYGINPGFSSVDEPNQYLSGNLLQSILGQVSPLIKDPFELATGSQVGTGGKINDMSDYIDAQLPVVAPISRLTGDSVTGSLASILQGKGLDPQYQIAKGNKDQGTSQLVALTNYLTGAGLQGMSQKNQINQAELQKRNASGTTG